MTPAIPLTPRFRSPFPNTTTYQCLQAVAHCTPHTPCLSPAGVSKHNAVVPPHPSVLFPLLSHCSVVRLSVDPKDQEEHVKVDFIHEHPPAAPATKRPESPSKIDSIPEVEQAEPVKVSDSCPSISVSEQT